MLIDKQVTHLAPLPGSRTRDGARSRVDILDVAETLFAERGFDAVSLAEVGSAAGLSRGAPGYFFGSKDALYRAVLDRLFAESRQRLLGPRALPEPADLPALVAWTVSEYVDFLTEHPNFVSLMEREVLAGGVRLGEMPEHARLVRDGTAMVAALLGGGDLDHGQATQLMLSFMGLVWFPLAHPPLLRDLGVDPDSGTFREDLKRHVTAVLLGAIG